MSKGSVELEAAASAMMRQERAVFEMTKRQTGCEVGEKIVLKQKHPDILLKCYELLLPAGLISPNRLWISWQSDLKSGKPFISWQISKDGNDQ